SLTTGALLDGGNRSLIRNRLNSTQTGRYVFRARGGQILPPLAISGSCPLPSASLNAPYSTQFTAVGGGTNLRWVQVADPGAALVPGLNLSSSGLYSGTPTVPGTFEFTVRMTANTEDGDQTVASRCSITVDPPRLSIVSSCPLPAATVGQAYSRTLQINGGRAPYTWSLGSDGTGLPRGLSISPAGVISGVPLAEGSFDFSISASSNTADGASPATKFCGITVRPAVLDLTTSCALPGATAGVPYSQTLTVAGGTAPFSWSTIGLLPTGLSLSPDGRITGTPSVSAQFQFSTRVVDAHGTTSIQSCRLPVTPPVVSVANSCPLPAGTTGESYSQQLSAENGSGGYSWSLIGSLPAGLTLSGNGLLSGRPMSAGPSSFDLLVSDSQGRTVAKPCTLSVLRSSFSVASCPISNATVGVSFSRLITADGGQDPYVFSAASNLPPGLSIGSYGLMTGTPTTAGTFPMTVRVLDSTGRTTVQPCAVTVAPSPLAIAGSCPLPKARVGIPYSSPFTANGGTAPYVFALTGSLPPGLSLTANGTVTGTPTAAASSEFQVRVRDAQSRISGLPCSIEVAIPDPPTIRLNSTAAAVLNPASAGPTVTVDLGSVYSLPIQGTLVLTNVADTGNPEGSANQPDPRVRFNNGQTSINFTIAPGTRQFSAPIASTGTVSATLTIGVTNLRIAGSSIPLVPGPKVFTVRRSIPVVTDACFNIKGTGIEAVITGYTTTRQLTSAVFTLTPPASATVDVAGSASDYFRGDDSIRNGGAFVLTVPFTAEGGTITGASFTLSNSVGASASRTMSRCQ
ncbi:MAG: putative Ig domain-containing protein, partial [Bryobacteraceae bacterium]